jgi:hypothetical protein
MASQTRALVRACRDAALRVLKAPVSPGVRQVVRRREERAREVRVGSNAVIRLRAQRPLLSFPLPNFLVLVSSVSGQMTTVFSRPQEKQTMKKRGGKRIRAAFPHRLRPVHLRNVAAPSLVCKNGWFSFVSFFAMSVPSLSW